MRRFDRRALATAAFGLFVLVLTACGTATPTATPPPVIRPTATATLNAIPVPTLPPAINLQPTDAEKRVTVRFINGLATPFDVIIEGNIVASSVQFGFPSEPTYINSGDYRVRIVPGGAGLDLSKAVLDQRVRFPESASIALVVSGTPGRVQLSTFTNNLAQIGAGEARVTFGHALPATGLVTVRRSAASLVTLGLAGQTVEAPILKAVSSDFDFTQDGSAVQFTTTIALREGLAYMAIAVGDGAGARAAVFADLAERQAQIRAIHAANNDLAAQYVDFYIDNRLVGERIAYGTAGAWQKVAARAYTVAIVRTGEKPTVKPLYTAQIDLAANAASSLVLFSAPGGPGGALIPEDLTPTTAGYARMVIVNAVPGAGALQFLRGAVADTRVPPFAFGLSSKPFEIAAGPADFGFRSRDGEVDRTVENKDTAFSIMPGTSYLYIADGDNKNNPILFTSETGIKTTESVSDKVNFIQVRFVNALADGSVATLKLGAADLFANVAPGKMTAPVQTVFGIAQLNLVGADGKTLATVTPAAVSGGSILLIATGSGADVRLVQQVETSAPTSSAAVVQVIHAVPGGPRLYVTYGPLVPTPVAASSVDRPTDVPTRSAIQPLELARQLDYRTVSGTVPLSPGGYTITINNSVNGSRLAQVDLTLVAGKRYDIVLLPADNGLAPFIFTTGDLPAQ